MTLYVLLIMAMLFPIAVIVAFIVGYNINAERKLFRKKTKKTEDQKKTEELISRIDNASVY